MLQWKMGPTPRWVSWKKSGEFSASNEKGWCSVKFSLGGFGGKGRYPTYRFSYHNSQEPSTKIKKSHRMDFWLPLTPSNPHGAGLETYFGFGILPQRKPVTFSPGFRCQLVLETLGSDVKKNQPTDHQNAGRLVEMLKGKTRGFFRKKMGEVNSQSSGGGWCWFSKVMDGIWWFLDFFVSKTKWPVFDEIPTENSCRETI